MFYLTCSLYLSIESMEYNLMPVKFNKFDKMKIFYMKNRSWLFPSRERDYVFVGNFVFYSAIKFFMWLHECVFLITLGCACEANLPDRNPVELQFDRITLTWFPGKIWLSDRCFHIWSNALADRFIYGVCAYVLSFFICVCVCMCVLYVPLCPLLWCVIMLRSH